MSTAAATIMFGNLEFETAKHVTVPLLKVPDDGTPIYVQSKSAIFKAEETSNARKSADGKTIAPPELMHVVNLQTGEVAQIIVSAVLGAELRRVYPNDTYVEKYFMLKKHKIATGKRYSTFEITELRPKGSQPEATKKR